MIKISVICIAAILALAAPSPSRAEDWTEYCYTDYRIMGWLLMQRHVCVSYSGAQTKGPWVQYQF